MDATALWDFEATNSDELGVKRGSKFCVVTTDDSSWLKAYKGLESGYVPTNYVKIEPHEWYKGPMTRAESERFLLQLDARGNPIYFDGCFVIRRSESDQTSFAVSIKFESTVQHYKILIDSSNRFYIWPNHTFASINELVEKYRTENVSGDRRFIMLRDQRPEIYEALYDFTATNDDEIELKRGDIIRVINKADDNWWEGEVRGRIGLFPSNYVKDAK